jgi:hypothetical protein
VRFRQTVKAVAEAKQKSAMIEQQAWAQYIANNNF